MIPHEWRSARGVKLSGVVRGVDDLGKNPLRLYRASSVLSLEDAWSMV